MSSLSKVDSLHLVMNSEFRVGKVLFHGSLLTRWVLTLVAAIAGYTGLEFSYSLAIFIATSATYLLSLQASQVLSHADAILRTIERNRILGMPIGAHGWRQLLDGAWTQRTVASDKPPESYWESDSAIGVQEGILKVEESAWWSGRLSRATSWGVFFAAMVVSSTVLLGTLTWLVDISDTIQREKVARFAVALIGIFVGGGMFHFSTQHASFAAASQRIEARAHQMASTSASREELIVLLFDYQLARAGKPPMPGVVHWLLKGWLNQLWKHSRSATDS